MKRTLPIAFITFFGMLPCPVDAQTPTEARLIPQELVVSGFTPTSTGLVLARLDDQDVVDAWSDVRSARAAFAAAQSACLDARIALSKDPGDTDCQQAAGAAWMSVQSLRDAYEGEVATFEALLFDQVDGSMLTELRRVRAQSSPNLPPEMLALDWDNDQMAALSAAMIEERRCQRRGEEVGAASAALLSSARSDSAVVAAQARLQTYLSGVTALVDGAE